MVIDADPKGGQYHLWAATVSAHLLRMFALMCTTKLQYVENDLSMYKQFHIR
jgi:hypothetical protein